MKNKLLNYMSSKSVAEQFTYKVKEDAKKDMIRVYAPMILLIITTIFAAIFVNNFFSWKNITNLMYQMSIPLVLATGITFVLLIGSIDLSLEGVMGFSGAFVSVLVANSMTKNDFGILGIIITIVICAIIGAITGLLHVKMRISSFIITYAVGSIITGFGVLTYGGTPAKVTYDLFITISNGSFLGIPYITYISFIVFFIGCIILNFTAFGRAVYAIGDNEIAARSTGINVDLVKIKVFSLCACTSSIAGILSCMRLKLGQVSIGTDQLFPVITVLGGASLSGGKGGMLQTFVGVLIYTELSNFLTIMGINPYYKKLIQGIIIIIAVALTIAKNRKTIAK